MNNYAITYNNVQILRSHLRMNGFYYYDSIISAVLGRVVYLGKIQIEIIEMLTKQNP